MNLVTPDGGLLFWMVIIFGLLFFVLAKFGFPLITSMVDKRGAAIDESLRDAEKVAEEKKNIGREKEAVLTAARKQQADILRDADRAGEAVIAEAKSKAQSEADAILEDSRRRIRQEKEAALRDVRNEVAAVSVGVAEKVLRGELSSDKAQSDYIDRLLDEVERK